MKYTIKSRIWIEADGEILLGEGRVNLLKAIEETGSLTKAAKCMEMSYKKAWRLVDTVNSRAKKPVVTSSIGGKSGGGTALTDYGRSLVSTFDAINHHCWDFLDKEIKQYKL
ncbi:molybdenum transporter [Pukyongia salina]|uniref:Molybdenum transporter n=1 Tax=Pukyongia salina TaxID=2094025 RepID=A0A2S0HXQ3_9FLAO|nr:LysR family transcriptional regulator [Pukyongia salina]AVI50953.1 molybdenum transporter [Pukyongia salina]